MTSHNLPEENDPLEPLIASLTEKPDKSEVVASFRKTMSLVTIPAEERILLVPHIEEPIISPFLMQLQTKLSLIAGTLVVVLVVGYMTYNRQSPYQSIEESLLENESAYEFASDEDSFNDLDEDFRDDPTALAGTEAGTTEAGGSTAPAPVATAAVDVTANLAAIDTMFAEDDLDDSSLQSWSADVSAAEALTSQSYDF